jgi:hypothetical protein
MYTSVTPITVGYIRHTRRNLWPAYHSHLSFEHMFELSNAMGTPSTATPIIWGSNCFTACNHISTKAVWVKYGPTSTSGKVKSLAVLAIRKHIANAILRMLQPPVSMSDELHVFVLTMTCWCCCKVPLQGTAVRGLCEVFNHKFRTRSTRGQNDVPNEVKK